VAIFGEDLMKSLNAILSIPDQALLLELPKKGANVSFPTRDAFIDQEAYYRHPIELNCRNCVIPWCKNKSAFVEILINGKKTKAFIDTGTPKTAINLKASQEFGIDRVGQAAEGDTTKADGHDHKTERVELEEFRIGEISVVGLRPQIFQFSDQLADGHNMKDVTCIIGMDLLKATDAHVSYHKMSIHLKRSEAKK